MLRFKVGSFPVEIHLSHFVLSGLVAWSFMGSKNEGRWPEVILANDAHPKYALTYSVVLVSWMLLVTLSILVHELGHALAARIFGARPEISLVGLGGYTRAHWDESLEWWKDLLFTVAGPVAGLSLGVFAGLVTLAASVFELPEPLFYFAHGVFVANLWWTVLNLLPISSLDGGKVATILSMRLFGRPGFLVAQLLAAGTAGLFLLGALFIKQPFLAVLVGLMLMRTFANIAAYRRGELPAGPVVHPMTLVVERAEALYRERKLAEAELIAKSVVEDAQTPLPLRSRASMLLGWVALKEGNGRRALDCFAQVQGLQVPPQALAAGFSLVGDEAQALPLWAQAAQVTKDDVVLHEYAGALIRAGRVDEARALPEVHMTRAYAAAERVYYVRQEYERAAQSAEAAFFEEPHPLLAYTAACSWARAGHRAQAFRMLILAAQNGYRNVNEAKSDPDLRILRGTPEFEGWLSSLSDAPTS